MNTFCRQASGAVQCYDANGNGITQSVQSGAHFIRGYGNADTGTGAPQLRTAYLDGQSLTCAPYFNSVPSTCPVRLNVAVDLGALLGQYPNPNPPPAQTPQQRSFMGELDRTGALRWLRLTVDQDCDLTTLTDRNMGGDPITGADAASQPAGADRCYVVDMGLSGGLARDQDEPPIALNLGSGSSQRALIDCDPNLPNLKEEVVSGCQTPAYSANKFNTTPLCPGTSGFFNTPKAAPFNNWPPFRCVLTQTTAAANQITQGFNERLFAKSNNPRCPNENTAGYPTPPGGKGSVDEGTELLAPGQQRHR